MTAQATSNPSESSASLPMASLPVSAVLDRPRSSWPAWLTGLVLTVVVLLQCLAGLSIAYFSQVMAESNRSIQKTNESLLALSVKVEANTTEMRSLNRALGKFDLMDQRLKQLEYSWKDHEDRLRGLERVR